MKVAVYDTYVPIQNGVIMHFDILVVENTSVEDVYKYGKEYLIQKGIPNTKLTTQECKFCHIEKAPIEIENAIHKKGFYIIEMENCN
jgi:hypothetical protein